MNDSQTRDRIYAHTLGATLAMGVVVWWMAWPAIVESGPWWAR
jgi:hypothetical protein